jgi:hypothetical protein
MAEILATRAEYDAYCIRGYRQALERIADALRLPGSPNLLTDVPDAAIKAINTASGRPSYVIELSDGIYLACFCGEYQETHSLSLAKRFDDEMKAAVEFISSASQFLSPEAKIRKVELVTRLVTVS